MNVTADLLYRLLVQGVSQYAIYMLDQDGLVLNWNAGAEWVKGYAADQIVGRSFEVFYSPEDRAAGLPRLNLETTLQEGRLVTEGWRFRRDESRFWAGITIDAIHDAAGRFVGFAKVTRDLTKQRELLVSLEYQANHDALTGLLNRAGLFLRIERDLASGAATAIHCIDLDHFKIINDRFGHPTGDAVLRELAERLEHLLLGRGYAGRLGGDELVAVQTPIANTQEARDLAEAIVLILLPPVVVDDTSIKVGACVGVAVTPVDGTDLKTLLRRADAALYRAKGTGGRRAVISGES